MRGPRKLAAALFLLIIAGIPFSALADIPQPTIPDRTFDVTNFGAVGDAVADDTAHLQAAIDAASAAGGGIVLLPQGKTFVSNPLTVSSHINIQIDGVLQAALRNDYLQPKKSLITFLNAHDVALTGHGIIDGRGGIGPHHGWWGDHVMKLLPASSRPRLVRFTSCDTVLIRDITLRNSPSFHIIFGKTDNVTIDDVTVSAPSSESSQVSHGPTSHNTDGIDPHGSNYLIENCNISDGDDNIAISGTAPCKNITVKNCKFGTGHGLSVDEPTAGIDGVTVTDCTFDGTTNGIRLKDGRNAGGIAQNLTYSNIKMYNVRFPLFFTSYYVDGHPKIPPNPVTDSPQPMQDTTPVWKNITIRNLTAESGPTDGVAAMMWGLPESPILNVKLINVKISAARGMLLAHVRNLTFDSSCKIDFDQGNTFLAMTYPSLVDKPFDATILPDDFSNQDIGSPRIPNGTCSSIFDPNTNLWTLQGDGAGIGSAHDQFNFSSTPVSGNATISAQLTQLTSPDDDSVSEAGLLFRAGNAPGDPFIAIVQTTKNQLILKWRTDANATSTTSDPIPGIPVGSVQLKITRTDGKFTAVYSSDAVRWIQIGPEIEIPALKTPKIVAGLLVAAGSDGKLAPAQFTHVAITP
jgi:polygalacturonase